MKIHVVLNIELGAHTSNEDLYRGRPKLSTKIAARGMRLAGHCHKHKELPAGTLVLWEPTPGQGCMSQGGATDTMKEDTGLKTPEEMARCECQSVDELMMLFYP